MSLPVNKSAYIGGAPSDPDAEAPSAPEASPLTKRRSLNQSRFGQRLTAVDPAAPLNLTRRLSDPLTTLSGANFRPSPPLRNPLTTPSGANRMPSPRPINYTKVALVSDPNPPSFAESQRLHSRTDHASARAPSALDYAAPVLFEPTLQQNEAAGRWGLPESNNTSTTSPRSDDAFYSRRSHPPVHLSSPRQIRRNAHLSPSPRQQRRASTNRRTAWTGAKFFSFLIKCTVITISLVAFAVLMR